MRYIHLNIFFNRITRSLTVKGEAWHDMDYMEIWSDYLEILCDERNKGVFLLVHILFLPAWFLPYWLINTFGKWGESAAHQFYHKNLIINY